MKTIRNNNSVISVLLRDVHAIGIHGITGRPIDDGWLSSGAWVRRVKASETGTTHFQASTDDGQTWYEQLTGDNLHHALRPLSCAYLPERSPTGLATAELARREDDGTWTIAHPTRPGERLVVEESKLVASRDAALRMARRRWNAR